MFYDSENGLGYNHSCTNCHNDSYYRYNFTDVDDFICVFHDEDDLSTSIFKVSVYVMYITVFVTALVGNGLVCTVVQTTARMKTVTNYFIVNLAVGDILMTLFCVPFSFVPTLLLRYWPFGAFMCKAVNFSQAVSVLVSAYTMLAISIDRYIIIMHPLKPRLSKTAAKLVVFAVWSGALVTAAPIPIVSKLQRPSLWHQTCEVDICGEVWSSTEQSRQYTYALLVLQFVLPLSALVCTYTRIAHTVWGGRPPGEAQDARDSRIQHSKRKMVKMMLTVVTVFIMSWLPLNIFIVLWTVHENDDEWASWPGMPYVWFACHWLAMSHSCYNPMIYCYMNIRYRQGFQEIFSALLCLKKKDSTRPCQRSSVCEGIPMSELMGANGTGTANRRVIHVCRCQTSKSTAVSNGSKSVTCTFCTPKPASRSSAASLTPPVRAASVRSQFF
ncbi:RYamide receptor-like [Spodoptera litura]|uniref:RYamide receptor-like n=1 Tax=Spodoptera litura TaxID=69820 RepID=A0A9J7IS86_SPOLT|nr:RYamide receptor-like [Spodoptera litura]